MTRLAHPVPNRAAVALAQVATPDRGGQVVKVGPEAPVEGGQVVKVGREAPVEEAGHQELVAFPTGPTR